jgi:hypothetical protein
MANLSGIYEAIVTDTDCFEKTGKIKTRISVLNDFYIDKDLRNNYNLDKFKEGLEKDMYTQIFLPFGGGSNYGMFTVPPVNSLGLVSFIDGDITRPVWMGGISDSSYTKTGTIHTNTAPSDDLFSNKSIISYNNGSESGEVNSEDIHSLVIKTKVNNFDDLSDPETINWEKREVENGIVLNKNKMELVHFNEDGYQGILLSSKENEDYIKIVNNKNEANYSSISMEDDGIRIETTRGDTKTTVNILDSSVLIHTKKDEFETTITQTEKEIKLKNDRASVILKKDKIDDEIILNAQKVRISANDIIMGNGDFRAVVAQSNFNMSLEDGTVLTTAKNVRM